MNRQSLAQASIIFRDEPFWEEDSPSQAQELHNALLKSSHLGNLPEIVGESRTISRWARTMLTDCNPTAQAWRHFYLRNFVVPMRKSTNAAGRVSQGLRPSQRVLAHRDCLPCLKNLSSQLEPLGWPAMSKVPVAEPTATLCFPADELAAFQGTDTDPFEVESWVHILRAHITDTFTASTKDHLDQLGFLWDQESLDLAESEAQTEPDSLCFPWFVANIEASSSEGTSQADCRAASVCVPSIVSFGRLAEISIGDLAEDAVEDPTCPDDFPVVAMTASGKDVCVWIVYWHETYRSYNTVRAWTGDITTTADVTKLRVILANLAEWAKTKLQPKISNYVTRWRNRFLSACLVSNDEDDDEVDIVTNWLGNLHVARTNSWKVGPLGQKATDKSAMVTVQAIAESPLEPTSRSLTSTPPIPNEGYSISSLTPVVLQHSSPVTASIPRSVGGSLAPAQLSPYTGRHAKPRRERPQSFDARLYEGVKFNLEAAVPRAQDDSEIRTAPLRVFNANHFEGVAFSFDVPTRAANAVQV